MLCVLYIRLLRIIGVEFWFYLGGGGGDSYLMTPRWVRGYAPGKFLNLGALKLHFQHPENTFGQIF